MARNTLLSELIDLFRAEASLSLNRSSGQQQITEIRILLRRTQEFLYYDYDWPFAQTRAVKTINNGQTVYAFPDNLLFDNTKFVGVLYNDDWVPLDYGIEDHELARRELYPDEKSWPLCKWQADGNGGFEVYPRPDRAGKLLLKGKRTLPELVDEDKDRAFLDDTLIAMFAAVEWLSEKNPTRAQTKQTMAQQHYAKLKAHQSTNKRKPVSMSGASMPTRAYRAGRDYVSGS